MIFQDTYQNWKNDAWRSKRSTVTWRKFAIPATDWRLLLRVWESNDFPRLETSMTRAESDNAIPPRPQRTQSCELQQCGMVYTRQPKSRTLRSRRPVPFPPTRGTASLVREGPRLGFLLRGIHELVGRLSHYQENTSFVVDHHWTRFYKYSVVEDLRRLYLLSESDDHRHAALRAMYISNAQNVTPNDAQWSSGRAGRTSRRKPLMIIHTLMSEQWWAWLSAKLSHGMQISHLTLTVFSSPRHHCSTAGFSFRCFRPEALQQDSLPVECSSVLATVRARPLCFHPSSSQSDMEI